MPATKKIRVRKVAKKTTTTAKSKSKVSVVVNVNSGNRKKVIGGSKSAPVNMPAVAPPPVFIPPPSNPTPTLATQPDAHHNSLTDGHVQYLHNLTTSMVHQLRQQQYTTPPLPIQPFVSPEPVQGDLSKTTDDLPKSLKPDPDEEPKKEWIDPSAESRGRSLFKRGATRSESPVPYHRSTSSVSPSPHHTPRPKTRAQYIQHFSEDYGITGLQNFNVPQLERIWNATDKTAVASAIKRERKRQG